MASGDERRKTQRAGLVLTIIGTAVFLALFGWLWWHWVPVLYEGYNGITQAERLTAVTNTRTALLAGLAALGALGTLWLNGRGQRFTVQSLRLTEENLRQTKSSQEETFRLAERGHLTDRYSKAIEQLGSDKLDVRLGGIYALEQLATDSPNDRDQATIVEVLSAFVRVKSDPTYQCYGADPHFTDRSETAWDAAVAYVEKIGKPPLEVEAAITVLGRLPEPNGVSRGDLSRSCLIGAQLVGANLAGANLEKANLAGSNLHKASLARARFSGACLKGASITQADLRLAWFDNADLTRAHLALSDMTKAFLYSADLTDTIALKQKQVDVAVGDGDTKLPRGLRYPKTWRGAEGAKRQRSDSPTDTS